MLTGQLRSQIDRIWDAFWSGGISNPLEVIEQITYLLFLRRLDDLETLEENRAARLGEPMTRRFYPDGKDALERPYEQFRWSRFKNQAPAEMFAIVRDSVFPFLWTLGADDSTYAHHMRDARFTIPTPALLARVVGDQRIGHVLWYAPVGSDGIHPHEAVREVIEREASSDIDTGFQIEAVNSRGAVFRGKGGGQEREIAAQFRTRSEVLSASSPRTSRIFASLAERYEADARREDEREKDQDD